MHNKFLKILVAVVGFSAASAMANTVSLVQPNPIFTNGAATLDLDLIGTFTDAVDAGDFSISWDATVLQYAGIVVADPPWDTSFIGESQVASGLVDLVFLGNSGAALTDFPILTISFNVIGADGTSTTVDMFEGEFSTGWSAPGGIQVPVTYIDGQVTVSPVPVPAAVWLMASGLLGLVGVARRRRS